MGADNGLLEDSHRPFAKVAKIKIPQRPKHESELPTDEEYLALLKWADYDLGQIRGEDGRYRQRRPEECRYAKENPYDGFSDILRCYYALGPRTGELATIRVRDVDLRKGQIVLDKHKRSKTTTTARPRILTLNADTHALFRRMCHGKASDQFVFRQDNGQPWNQDRLDNRFAQFGNSLACVTKSRSTASGICGFRTALEAGVSYAEVAEMAGTSIAQIEATYGHVRSAAKSQSQAMIAQHRANRAG